MSDRSAYYEELEQPQRRGQATEAILQAAFVVRDVPVLVPAYDDEPYDLVIEVGGRFHKIQCKTAYPKSDGTVAFETVSTRRRRDGYDRRGYDDRAEYTNSCKSFPAQPRPSAVPPGNRYSNPYTSSSPIRSPTIGI